MPYRCEHCPQETFEDKEELAGHKLGVHSENIFHDDEYFETRYYEEDGLRTLDDWSSSGEVEEKEDQSADGDEGFPSIGEPKTSVEEDRTGFFGKIKNLLGF